MQRIAKVIFVLLLVPVACFSAAIADEIPETIEVRTRFTPLPKTMVFNPEKTLCFKMGERVDQVVSYMTLDSIPEIKLLTTHAPDSIGFYILHTTVFDAETKEIINDLSEFQYVCIIKESDDPYLFQNYPNPIEVATEFYFYTPGDQKLSIAICNILGQVVDEIDSTPLLLRPGIHAISWKPDTSLPSGVYFYTLTSPSLGKIETRKMVIIR